MNESENHVAQLDERVTRLERRLFQLGRAALRDGVMPAAADPDADYVESRLDAEDSLAVLLRNIGVSVEPDRAREMIRDLATAAGLDVWVSEEDAVEAWSALTTTAVPAIRRLVDVDPSTAEELLESHYGTVANALVKRRHAYEDGEGHV